ncbi:extracellular solute-binding protein [Desulfonatronum thioautotrophicum]|uniref:extracellular solute-binding protein n=1 Tax=Desulfonatronum thioautotrophicum TaxID=617001 RepID=UPI0005EB3DBE|nr:extracellular solute-binding protein [Desulfonatronum thioautotrophicum]
MRKLMLILAALFLLTAQDQTAAEAQDVIVYSPFNDEFMQALSRPFTQESGIRIRNIVISTGESLSRLRAEAQRPQADFWLSVRPAILAQAHSDGLIEAYEPQGSETILQAYQYPEPYITAVGTYPLVFFYNTRAVSRAGLPTPSPDWDDMLNPALAGQIVMPHPATSGTAYAAITTMLQRVMQNGGTEEQGWEFIRDFSRNVAQFTRSGRAPQSLVAAGEYPIGVGFYDAVWQAQQEGFPIEVVVPNPVFAEPYGAAVVNNGPNVAGARAFFDYLLTPQAQTILTQFGNYPVIAGINPPEGGVVVPSEQVISIDFRWSADNRRRILDTFQEVTRAEPQ